MLGKTKRLVDTIMVRHMTHLLTIMRLTIDKCGPDAHGHSDNGG